MKVNLKIPASSANLGPGYDVLGMALNKYLEVSATRSEQWLVETTGEGAGVLPTDGRNLIAQTYTDICADQGFDASPLHIQVNNGIPVERGLGSSSTAIVAGALLAFLFHGEGEVDKQKVFEIATELEGHPDNVGPALLGGLRECGGLPGNWFALRRRIHYHIRLAMVIPRFPANTKTMRGLVPASFTDEQEQTSREAIGALLQGLSSGDPKGLVASEWDVKHQPYRFPALPESHEIYKRFQQSPLIAGAFLSGAGPSVAGWFFEKDQAAVEAFGSELDVDLEILNVDTEGATWTISN